jgi:hypothetical protein
MSRLLRNHNSTEELIRIATEEVEKTPAVPKPAPREDAGPRLRRTERLKPEFPPITWTDALEKYNPLKAHN